MGVLSKSFYRVTAGKTCSDYMHPYTNSCIAEFFHNSKTVLPGCFKLYVPLLVIPPLLKGRITRAYLIDHILGYASISWKTYVQAMIGMTSVCLLYNIFGKLHFYNAVALPGALSGYLAPKYEMQHLRLQGITFFNMMMEVAIRKIEVKWFAALRDSKITSTLAFMLFSGGIMHCLQAGDISQFWLITPTRVNERPKEHKCYCSHENTCWKFIAEGIGKYLIIGTILEVARGLISKFPVLMKRPGDFLPTMRQYVKMRLALFLGAYVGIYRLICCCLANYHKTDSVNYSGLAGLLSGVCYALYPKYQVFTLGLTKSIEICWEYLLQSNDHHHDDAANNRTLQSLLKRINKLPILLIVHGFSIGYMYHTSIFHPHLNPLFNRKALSFCSGNKIIEMKMNYYSWILGEAYDKSW